MNSASITFTTGQKAIHMSLDIAVLKFCVHLFPFLVFFACFSLFYLIVGVYVCNRLANCCTTYK